VIFAGRPTPSRDGDDSLRRCFDLSKGRGADVGPTEISDKTKRAIRAALSKRDRPGLPKIAPAMGVGVGAVQRISREVACGA
jgi:O-acetyl-ADP-ribose deacetylase (regulator of RNase III)